MRRLASILPLAAILVLVAVAALAMAQTDPPSTAGDDWVVEDVSYWDEDLVLAGNLTVNSSGSLKLDQMTLTMDPSVDGGLLIYVEAGSTLELANVTLKSSDPALHIWFEAQGQLVIVDSDVRDLAANSLRWNLWDDIAGGVQIYDNNSRLVRSKFHDSQRINVFVSGVAIEITDCEFYNAEYVSTYNYNRYSYQWGATIYGWYVDATGLYLEDSDSNITDCVFHNNGLRNTANQFYSTSYYYNGVMTFGRGLLDYNSAPNITGCTFRNNGDQPPDRTVEGVQQIFFEQFFWDDIPEGGLVCVGTSAHPTVHDSSFQTNDVFGIYGMGGGYPSLVDGCTVNGNRYLRGTTVYSPSGGIYIEEGGGTMTVANSSAGRNLVIANIWVYGTTLHLVNFSNDNNVVSNAYNIYVGQGNHRIQDCYLDARPGLATNLYVSYGNPAPKVRILGSELIGGDYGVYTTSWSGSYIFMANSSIRSTDQATFMLQSTKVDAVNCTFSPLRVESYSYAGSTVRIMYYLDIEVTWQNSMPIPGAFVQVFNESKAFVYGGIADENGTIGPLIVTSKTIYVVSSSQTEVSNSPLYIKAYSAGLESSRTGKEFVFISNLDARILIRDHVDPTIYVFSPGEGHAQNDVFLEVRGMCTDVGAGMNTTKVSTDGVNWIIAGREEQTWFVVLELEEGTHTIHIQAEDNAGNDVLMKVENIQIDLTPPTIEVLDPVKDTWYTSSVNYTLRGKVHGQESLIINRQEVEVLPDGSWSSTQEIHSGSNEFRITATDHVGNTAEVHKAIVRDSTIPKLILTSPEQDTWTNVSQVEVKGITELGATIRVNGKPIVTYGGRFAETIYLSEGLNSIIVEAVDRANNIMRVVRDVHLDSIPPLLRVESPQGDIMTNQRYLDIRGTIDDPTVDMVIINGLLVEVVDQAFSKDFRLDEGVNHITIEAWDNARNYNSRRYTILLDTTPPDLELEEPELYLETRESSVRIYGRVDTDVDLTIWGEPQHDDFDLIYLVRLENTFRYDAYPLVRGLNTIHILAEDDVGNKAHLVLEIDHDLVAPVLFLSAMVERTPNEIVEVSGILEEGDEVRINNVPVVLGPNGEFTEAVHLQKGKNALRVVAYDAAGNSATTVVNVTRYSDEPPPTGIMGAGWGVSIALILAVLVIGMAIIYPGIRSRRDRPHEEEVIEEEGLLHETPPWARGHGFPEIPPEPAPVTEEAPAPVEEPQPQPQPEPQPQPARPLPPPPPDHQEGPSVPPKPPWR